MDTRKPDEIIKDMVESLPWRDPAVQMKRNILISSVNRLDVTGSKNARAGKVVISVIRQQIIAGWGEQNYINHWWIEQKFPGMVKSACGINSTKSWVQWVEHYPSLIKCKTCQQFELKHLNARSATIRPAGGA